MALQVAQTTVVGKVVVPVVVIFVINFIVIFVCPTESEATSAFPVCTSLLPRTPSAHRLFALNRDSAPPRPLSAALTRDAHLLRNLGPDDPFLRTQNNAPPSSHGLLLWGTRAARVRFCRSQNIVFRSLVAMYAPSQVFRRGCVANATAINQVLALALDILRTSRTLEETAGTPLPVPSTRRTS